MTDIVKYTSQYLDNREHKEFVGDVGAKRVIPFLDNGDGTYTDQSTDPLEGYKITEIDGDYFGFANAVGGWYIMWNNGSAWRYLKGDADFDVAWAARVGAGYGYFYNIF